MNYEIQKYHILSIVLEIFGLAVMGAGIVFEYIYKADLFLFGITGGSLIFSLGSGLVKKFPWAIVVEKRQKKGRE